MDEDRIGLVLARASELRSKITNCIHQASSNEGKGANGETKVYGADPDTAAEEEDEATECLLNIRDALESLEAQLSSLQAIQQQQWYEKEAALSEIEYSQKKLLKKLKEYKGKDLEVIQEAIAFAGEPVEESSDLLLPPYPSRPALPSTRKLSPNGVKTNGTNSDLTKDLDGPERPGEHSESRSLFRGVKLLVGQAAKVALTIVGFISVLSLAGFEPRIKKRNYQFKVSGLIQHEETEEKAKSVECPPGRVLVVENGETRCLVKERVEIPFDSVVATPNVNFGCG